MSISSISISDPNITNSTAAQSSKQSTQQGDKKVTKQEKFEQQYSKFVDNHPDEAKNQIEQFRQDYKVAQDKKNQNQGPALGSSSSSGASQAGDGDQTSTNVGKTLNLDA